jgi:hypothetical protein
MATFKEATAAAKTLDDVLAIITDRQYEDEDFTSLPTFGGSQPDDTQGVWSWDETRLIVGSCADDFEIVER